MRNFCGRCGTGLLQEQKFCPKCGAATASITSPAPGTNKTARAMVILIVLGVTT